jgi:ABC-type multidrug transport system fused ATPase/permease subunit
MTSEQNGEAADKLLNDMVRDADEYYTRLNVQQVNQTRVYAAVMGAVIWFAIFAALGIALYLNVKGSELVPDLLWAFLTAVAGGVTSSAITYVVRRQRASKFAELGALLTKMKQGRASSEDGLRLMDLMHQAALTMRKQRLDSAFAYGIGAFILVSFVGLNVGFGALAGVVTYLYFRFEALREYEKEDEKYEVAKKDIILSL